MKMRRSLLAIAGVWVVAGCAVWWARASTPTAATVLRLLTAPSLDTLDASARQKLLDRVADQITRLDAEQRTTLRNTPGMREFFDALTPAEQGAFLEKILPSGFRQMMEALNDMPRQKRKGLVERAIADIRERGAEPPPPGVDEATVSRIAEEGLKAYYNESTAETKLDLAPLIEELQRSLRPTR
jgi:hypothetical protein